MNASVEFLLAYREIYKINLYIEQMLQKYPKKYYHTIGIKTRECNIDLLLKFHQYIINQQRTSQELHYIKMKIEELKLCIKISNEYKIVTKKQMSYLFFLIENVKSKLKGYEVMRL